MYKHTAFHECYHQSRLNIKYSPLEEAYEGGGNLLRVHAFHLLNASSDEQLHLFTLVDGRVPMTK